MKGFDFRLQKVLDHRQGVEENSKQIFVKSRLEYLKEKEKLDQLKQEMYRELETARDAKKVNAFYYINRQNYIAALEDKIKDQEKRALVFHQNMEKKREAFRESQKDRKVIEKLKEKAYGEFVSESERLEQNQNDEFALYGYVRK